ncbi:MAG: hypothetical protein HQM02_14070 [Magnetococcales bacterium]|nr:hypothetical protein [Magnetococcales bacterium]
MNRSIRFSFSLLLSSLLLVSSGACREVAPPVVAAGEAVVSAPVAASESAPVPVLAAAAAPEIAEPAPDAVAAAPEESPEPAMNPVMVAQNQAATPADEKGKKSKKKDKPTTETGIVKGAETRVIPGENNRKTPPLSQDGIHDPKSPAMQLLQNPSQALSAIPAGKWGEVDWMKAINDGVIKPLVSRDGKGNMELLDLDIILTNTKNMPHVRFPHISHTRWLACSNCHPNIFVAKKGSNSIKMDEIFRGKFCGACHGRVAFSIYICQRCHSIPHEGSPAKWW